MLELRPSCEHCGTNLPPDSREAMICTYECTFCKSCVENVLHNVCPNCRGGFEKRPVRPREELVRHPASTQEIVKPVDMEQFARLRSENEHLDPRER
jgi:hypothetical protein